MQISQKQIQEWSESPVTEFLRIGITSYVDQMFYEMGHAFEPFDPQKTQERMASIFGTIDALEDMILLFEGDFSFLELDSEDQDKDKEGLSD